MGPNTVFDVKVARKIDEFSAKDWQAVFPPALENYDFFKSLDESGFSQFSFHYLMVYKQDIPVAAASCFIMRFPLDITSRGPIKSIFNCIKRLNRNILNPKALMCGLPMGQGRIGIIENNSAVMDAICNSLEEIAKKEKAVLVIFKDFTSEYRDILRPLSQKGFHKIESLPNTEMDIKFNNFDEYLNTLNPVSRSGLKRNYKRVDGKVKIDLEVCNSFTDDVLPQAYRLYLETVEGHDEGLEKVPEAFFRQIAKNMPGEVKYFLWRIEGKLVAFAFCLVSGELFIDYYLGFDYSLAHKYHLYFIRFRDLMNWCIAHGINKYEMGPTGYEAKRRLGFDFVRLYYYIKPRNRIVNFLFDALKPLFNPENFDPVFRRIKEKIK